jgi:hypothetical protein
VQSNSYSPSESAALVRADYLYHVRTRGWNDVGYNFLVDRYGRVFEGRYGGVTRAVLGAHSGGFNTDTTGVALLGTFTTARPTSYMLAALGPRPRSAGTAAPAAVPWPRPGGRP